MAEVADPFICLKLADKSYYSLFKWGETGERSITLTPASKKQLKSEISLFNCSAGRNLLLRDILLENRSDIHMTFSLSHDFLSYTVRDSGGAVLTDGLIELKEDEMDIYKGKEVNNDKGKTKVSSREIRQRRPRRLLVLLSVFLSLLFLVYGAFSLSQKLSQITVPPLEESGVSVR